MLKALIEYKGATLILTCSLVNSRPERKFSSLIQSLLLVRMNSDIKAVLL